MPSTIRLLHLHTFLLYCLQCKLRQTCYHLLAKLFPLLLALHSLITCLHKPTNYPTWRKVDLSSALNAFRSILGKLGPSKTLQFFLTWMLSISLNLGLRRTRQMPWSSLWSSNLLKEKLPCQRRVLKHRSLEVTQESACYTMKVLSCVIHMARIFCFPS